MSSSKIFNGVNAMAQPPSGLVGLVGLVGCGGRGGSAERTRKGRRRARPSPPDPCTNAANPADIAQHQISFRSEPASKDCCPVTKPIALPHGKTWPPALFADKSKPALQRQLHSQPSPPFVYSSVAKEPPSTSPNTSRRQYHTKDPTYPYRSSPYNPAT